MKRFLILFAALMLLAAPACAEVVGRAGNDYIHRWVAPNGQELYFVSMEEDPFVQMKDVNFDGVEDVVVITFRGAANFGVEFFVWDGGAYVPVEHPGADRLVNYELYSELALVETGANDGLAGMLGDRQLWRWDGAKMTLVRGEWRTEVETWSYDGDLTTIVKDNGYVHMCVWDYVNRVTLNGVTGPALLLDTVVGIYDEEACLAAMDEADSAFWQGLLP